MKFNTQLASRLASAVLALVFVALVIFTILGFATIGVATRQTQTAVALSERYAFVERQLWKEASLVRVHGVDWQNADWYANLYAERAAADAIESTLTEIADHGGNTDRLLAAKTLAIHTSYVDLLRQLFAEVDEHAPQANTTFERSTRMFDIMESRIDRRASEQHAIATAALVRLNDTQTRISQLCLLAAVLGAAVVALSVWIILRYRRAMECSRLAELARLAEASLTDTLTKLGNHRAYQDDLERELARSERHGGTVSLALIDIDNFKNVNDTKGHIEGDRVLATVGTLLLGLRKSDRSFRLGGDEFAVVLSNTKSADAHATMDRLRRDVSTALAGITISVGISSTNAHDLDGVTLREYADAALYAAKSHGRNTVLTYAESQIRSIVLPTGKDRAIHSLVAEEV